MRRWGLFREGGLFRGLYQPEHALGRNWMPGRRKANLRPGSRGKGLQFPEIAS